MSFVTTVNCDSYLHRMVCIHALGEVDSLLAYFLRTRCISVWYKLSPCRPWKSCT